MLARSIFILMTVILCFQVQASEAVSISATVDRASISIDETVTLSIRVSPQASSAPSFSELETQFDILNRSQNSQYRNINGQIEAFTEWQLTLAPKATGKLVIPSIQYQQEYSDAIILQVSDIDDFQAGLTPDIFLEIQAENTEPYVQQQVIITVKLHTAVPLRVDDAPALNIPNALLMPLKDSQYQKRIGDKIYTVSELRYALFPQISGELEIPIQTFTVTARANAGFNNPQSYGQIQTKRIRSKPITLNVKPQAASFQGDHWLPASDLKIEEQWSNNSDNWIVGEPLTRKITVHATGLSVNQIPSLSLTESQSFKQYREKPESTDAQDARGLSTTITESIAIVPTQEGTADLPEVKIYWWDTSSNSEKVARLPARSVNINANPNLPTAPAPLAAPPATVEPIEAPATDTNTDKAQDSDTLFWQALSALLFVINLILLLLLVIAKQRGKSAQPCTDKSDAKHHQVRLDLDSFFSQGLNKQNAAQFLDQLQHELPEKTINALSNDLLAKDLKREISRLSAYTYGIDQTYDGDLKLLSSLVRQAQQHKSEQKPQARPLLSGLYPD